MSCGIVIQFPPFKYHKAVTLHDTNDNILNALFIQNVGTAGAVMIRQANQSNTTTYLLQGDSIPVGTEWRGAMSTGTGAGVELRAFY